MSGGVAASSTSELRQRRVTAAVEAVQAITEAPAMKRFARVDLFTKPKEEFRRDQSPLGAAVSAAALGAISLLLVYELLHYVVAWDAYTTELSVDLTPTSSQGVPVHFDITFPAIPCHSLSVDAIDATGTEENNVAHDLFKSPVDKDGRLVFEGKYNYVEMRLGPDGTPVGPKNYDERKDPRSPKFCGNCYIEPSAHHHQGPWDRSGGVLDQHAHTVHKDMCCNTCEDVFKFYALHRIPRPHAGDIEQCIDQMSRANPGCNIKGTLVFRKVRGNFHFTPGRGMQLGPFGQHIQTFDLMEALRFNTSHTVNHLSVGDPRIQRFSKRGIHFPLDGTTFGTGDHLAMVKYYLQIVPVSYENGRPKYDSTGHAPLPPTSYEFSAQRHSQEFQQLGFGVMPGIFFIFDFYPMQVHHVFERPTFTRFLVKSCSIIGGVFVVSGLIDRVVEWASRRLAGLQ